MIADFMEIVQEFIGSSHLLRAHGKGEASATILSFHSTQPPEKIAGGFQQAGKKEVACGKEFLPACHPAKRDWGGSGSALLLRQEKQSKTFFNSF
jgi:hypothetical protein